MAIKLMPVALPHEPAAPDESQRDQAAPAQPRKRRKASVFDADGNEVLITLKCLKCDRMRPLSLFGLRKMADGAIRNQPWCRDCRGASSPKNKAKAAAEAAAAPVAAPPVALATQLPSQPAVVPPVDLPERPSAPGEEQGNELRGSAAPPAER